MSERILVVDNYDSFVYNLVQFLGEVSNGEIVVFRNNKITPGQILEENPTHVVISPGPCTPDEAGVSVEVVRKLAGVIPIPVSYTHLRAHETKANLVCRLLLEKKKHKKSESSITS